MYSLVIQTGKNKGRRINLPDREVVIGRDHGCFIRLTLTEVSRRHCSLTPSPSGVTLRDLGSQNGTIVNNQAINGEVNLRVGDFVQFGSIQFQLTLTKPPKPSAALEDNDIAGWLSDGDSSELNTSDTTVIKIPELKNRAQLDQKQKFDTVTEEAQDIIRRHRELKPQE